MFNIHKNSPYMALSLTRRSPSARTAEVCRWRALWVPGQCDHSRVFKKQLNLWGTSNMWKIVQMAGSHAPKILHSGLKGGLGGGSSPWAKNPLILRITFQSSYLSQISRIILVEKKMSWGEISAFYTEFVEVCHIFYPKSKFSSMRASGTH